MNSPLVLARKADKALNLFLLGLLFALTLALPAHSQGSPVQWQYSWEPSGQALATYLGDVNIKGTLTQNGPQSFPGNVSIGGSLGVTGPANITGDITGGGNATITGTITGGAINTLGGITGGSLHITGNGQVDGNLGVGGTINAGAVNIGGVPVYPGHGLIGVQTFCTTNCTSGVSGTYTPDVGTNQIVVEVQAPGGGTGGCGATGTNQFCGTGGSAGGSYIKVLIKSGFSGIAVSAPVGGAGATAGVNNGASGATASFGSIISCQGGAGTNGFSAVTFTTFQNLAGGAPQTPPCTVSAGTIISAMAGQAGGTGFMGGIGAFQQLGSIGGSSEMGLGGQQAVTNNETAGNAGTGAGWGAGGNLVLPSQPAVGGLPGGYGKVIIWEYN